MKAIRPDLRIIVTGSGMDDESVLKAIAAGAKGYVDEAASPADLSRLFASSIRAQCGLRAACSRPSSNASAPPRAASSPPAGSPLPTRKGSSRNAGRRPFQQRDRLRLGIEERTVKAHVAKLMRKVGVQNRIALSVHAITHSLVTAK